METGYGGGGEHEGRQRQAYQMTNGTYIDSRGHEKAFPDSSKTHSGQLVAGAMANFEQQRRRKL